MQPVATLKVNTIFSQLAPLDTDYPGFVEIWSYLDAFLSYEIHNSFFIKAMSNKEFIRLTEYFKLTVAVSVSAQHIKGVFENLNAKLV